MFDFCGYNIIVENVNLTVDLEIRPQKSGHCKYCKRRDVDFHEGNYVHLLEARLSDTGTPLEPESNMWKKMMEKFEQVGLTVGIACDSEQCVGQLLFDTGNALRDLQKEGEE